MSTVPAYWDDSYRTELETELLELGTDERGPWVTLADTVLYPEGGGQPADHGWIGEISVHDVQSENERTVHRVRSLEGLARGPVIVHLDWQRRWDHMQQHTAQHLLTAVAADRFGWTTIGFHLGDQVSDIDVDAPEIDVEQLRALEDAVAVATRTGLKVVARWATSADIETLGARCRALPDDVSDTVRLIDIVAFAVVLACSTMFIRVLVLLAIVYKPLVYELFVPLTLMFGVGILFSFILFHYHHGSKGIPTDFKSPFRIGPALKFGVFFAVILFLSKLAVMYFGDRGLYLLSFFSGLADVDPIVLSLASLAKSEGGVDG